MIWAEQAAWGWGAPYDGEAGLWVEEYTSQIHQRLRLMLEMVNS